MKPYYQDDYATIYHGDCREILPTLPKCDLLLTDPPYGIEDWNNRGSNAARLNKAEEMKAWDVSPSDLTFKLMLEKSIFQIIWGANHFLDNLHSTKQMLVWDKMLDRK